MPIPEHGRRTSENPTLRSGATNLSDPRIADTCGVGVSNTSKRPVVDPSAWPPIKPARVQVQRAPSQTDLFEQRHRGNVSPPLYPHKITRIQSGSAPSPAPHWPG